MGGECVMCEKYEKILQNFSHGVKGKVLGTNISRHSD